MTLGSSLGYGGDSLTHSKPRVTLAESLGFDSLWTAEAYGSDALTPLAWHDGHTSTIKLGSAIVPLSARTPTATAMAAMTLDQLSDGRVMLRLGASGPQVVTGLGKPLRSTLHPLRTDIVPRSRTSTTRRSPL